MSELEVASLTTEDYTRVLTAYIDRVCGELNQRATTQSVWCIEDLMDIMLDFRNEVRLLEIVSDVAMSVNV